MRTVKNILCVLVLIFIFACAKTQNADIAITNINIIDATGTPAQEEMTVLIKDNQILKIGKNKKIKVAEHVQVVDGSGKFLIPGLWDMHVHWYKKEYLDLFIANGVTGIRHMWGNPEHLQWRTERIEAGLLCPRMEIGSPIVDGPNPMWPDSITIKDEEEARTTVQQLKEEGYDYIKVLNLVPKEAFLALAEECGKIGIPFAGHIPFVLSAEEACQLGLKSNEHLWGILLSCSSKEEEFRDKLIQAIASNRPWKMMMFMWMNQRAQYLKTFDQKKADNLFQTLVKWDCWQCPTLTVNRSMAYLFKEEFHNDPRLKYMPSDITDNWKPPAMVPPQIPIIFEDTYHKYLELIKPMHKAGVRFLAGTDVLNPFCFPGFSLHNELDLLVQAGLTPIEALQAATRNAAEYLDRLDSLGTVEEGKMADLVLLEANPLEDIRNTQKINAVIFDGQLFEKAALEKKLQDIEILAKSQSEELSNTIE